MSSFLNKRHPDPTFGEIAWRVVGAIVVIALLALLVGIVFQFGWNIGVIGLGHAVGLNAAEISLRTAIGGAVALSFAQALLHGISIDKK